MNIYSKEIDKYETFMNAVKDMIKGYKGEDYNVDIRPVVKNNGCIFYGLTIMKEKSKVAPTIYLEPFYERYKMGVRMDHIIDEILHVNEINTVTNQGELEFFMDYEKVREKLTIRLINYKENESLLKDVPHRRYLDLAVVACVEAFWVNNTFGSVLIHNNHICMWGVKKEELIDEAINNCSKTHPAIVKPLAEIVQELGVAINTAGDAGNQNESDLLMCANTMIVVSNDSKVYGAAVIVYPQMLKNMYKALGREYYIIPSSVHEVIVIRKNNEMQPQNINMMINEVNSSELAREDILSNHVYEYDSETEELRPIYSCDEAYSFG